jgi:hypothetical protein
MSGEPEGPVGMVFLTGFQAVVVAKEFLVIQCKVCNWIGGVDPPYNLFDLARKATDHAKVCTHD